MDRLNLGQASPTPGGGGGHDIDAQFPARQLQSHGFIALAFGFALALTLSIFFIIFKFIRPVPFGLENWLDKPWPNLAITFLIALVVGTLIAAIYNMLIFHRLNMFGLGRHMD